MSETSDTTNARLAGPGAIEIVRVLPGPIERVWSFLVEPAKRAQWLAAGVIGNAPGAPIAFDFDHQRFAGPPPPGQSSDAASFQGTILVYEPPRLLSFSWPEARGGPDTVVIIRLDESSDGVRLHLRHEGLTDPRDRNGAAGGWHAHLFQLGQTLAGENGDEFWQVYQRVHVRYETMWPGDETP